MKLFLFALLYVSTCLAKDFACPSGIAPLDDSYPARAVVVSDIASKGYQIDKMSLLQKMIPEILSHAEIKVLFIAKDDNFNLIVKNLSSDQRKRLINIKKVPKTNWLQDPWVAQFAGTGRTIQLRALKNYNGKEFDSEKLVRSISSELARDLPIQIGASLSSLGKSEALSGQYGGNIIGMGSLCLVGSSNLKDRFKEFTQEVCRESERVVKVPTSFLLVGHADEVVKVLPNQNAEGNKGCGITLAVASSRKAKAVLQENPEDLFFDFRDNDQKPLEPRAALLQIKDRRYYRMLCMHMMGIHRQNTASRWVDDAFPIEDDGEGLDFSPCLKFKNKDFLNLLKDHSDYNRALEHIQEKFDDFVRVTQQVYKKTNNNCRLDIVEIPQLYAGRIRQTIRNGFKPRLEAGQSLFPNLSNGEVIEEKYLLPDPVNASFRADIVKTLSVVGLEPVFLNTHFAHRLQGNLHCIEKTIRSCQSKKPIIK